MDGEPYSGAVGIDLGTTYSCVGVWKNNRVETTLNDQGNRITPSYVAFTKCEKLVGDVAKNQAIANYKNSLFDSKRLIGRNYQDERVQYDKEHWPFEILERNDKIVYKVMFRNETIYVTPEEVAAEILGYLKRMAEKHLGRPVKDVVISVPAYFNNHQRQSTINSATMAGLNVHAVINEPTAAAIAFGMENMSSVTRKVLVFDLGGGTFDVSLLNIQGEHFEVLATAGDTHLGGNDFDIRLVNYFIEEFNNQTGLDITENSTALGRLRSYAEKAKRVLSTAEFTSINIDCLFESKDFHSPISRRKFEELCKDLFDSTIELLDSALDDVSVQKNEIDEVVMIGGSTRICKIQELVSNYFGGRILQNGINPEEAVAHGATFHATKFTKSLLESMKDLTLADITPLSLGIEMKDQAMATIIRRNTTIPVTRQRTFTTTEDYQTEVRIEIYEGESTNSKLNTRLGLFRLNGIPSALRGYPKVDVTFTIDANGVLNVTACERETGSTNHLDIVYERDIVL